MSEETSKVLRGGQAKKPAYEPGQVVEVKGYPFVRCVKTLHDFDETWSREGWRPGCEKDIEDGGNVAYAADGLGAMLLEVVQVVKLPNGFAPRVFYVRKWRDPDGKVFGKRRCRVTTTSAFSSSWLRGGFARWISCLNQSKPCSSTFAHCSADSLIERCTRR